MKRKFSKVERVKLTIAGLIATTIVGYVAFSFIFHEDSDEWVNEREYVVNDRWVVYDLESLGIPLENTSPSAEGEVGETGADVWLGENSSVVDGDNRNVLLLESPQDTIYTQIINGLAKSDTLVMKVFYNYEEVLFRIHGIEEYKTEFLFTMPSETMADIPFQLDSSLEATDSPSRLTVVLFNNADEFIKLAPTVEDANSFSNNITLVSNFEINYGSGSSLLLELDLPTATVTESIDFDFLPGITIVQNFIYGEIMDLTNTVVAPGEQIEFEFIVNQVRAFSWNYFLETEPPPVTDFLIVAMLDWQQIPMSDQPYLWVSTGESKTLAKHGRFTIEAPLEPGFYDFVAFVVPNPIDSMDLIGEFLNGGLDYSNRFTIEVVE